MNSMRNSMVLCLIVLCAISCNLSSSDDSTEKAVFPKEIHRIKEISFPKQIKRNDTIMGELLFDNTLDSLINLRLIKRYTYLYVTTEELDTLSSKEIQKVKHNTFMDTLSGKRFKYFSKFDNGGGNIISFVIEDNLLLNPIDTNFAVELKTVEYVRRLQLKIIE